MPGRFRRMMRTYELHGLRFCSELELDAPVVPEQGLRVTGGLEWRNKRPGAAESYPVVEAGLGGFGRLAKSGSVFLLVAGGSTLGHAITTDQERDP